MHLFQFHLAASTYVVDIGVLVGLLAHAVDPLDADLGGLAVKVRDQHVVPRQVLVGVLDAHLRDHRMVLTDICAAQTAKEAAQAHNSARTLLCTGAASAPGLFLTWRAPRPRPE